MSVPKRFQFKADCVVEAEDLPEALTKISGYFSRMLDPQRKTATDPCFQFDGQISVELEEH